MLEYKTETVERLKKLPGLDGYRNRRPLVTIKGTSMFVEDIMKASVASGSSLLALGYSGFAKTMIMKIAASVYFNNEAVHLRGSDYNQAVKDVFLDFDLKKLDEKQASRLSDIRKIQKTDYHIYLIDEINRSPPLVQNQWFELADGKIVLDGVEYKLGQGKYNLVLASANEMDEGTYPIAYAMLWRCNTILNVDDVMPTPQDIDRIAEGRQDPRITEVKPEDHKKEILELYEELTGIPMSVEMRIMFNYLITGLDYCKYGSKLTMREGLKVPEEFCKDITKGNQPGACNRLGNGCGYIRTGVPPRTAETVILMTKALQVAALAKGAKPELESDFSDVFETLKLGTAYTGLFNYPAWFFKHPEYRTNRWRTVTDIVENLKKRAIGMQEPIREAVLAKMNGTLAQKHVDPFKEDWAFFPEIIDSMADLLK